MNYFNYFDSILYDSQYFLSFLKYQGCLSVRVTDSSFAILEKWKQPLMFKKMPKTLEDLRLQIQDCTRCNLCKDRNNIVFGAGNPNAKLVFITEAPNIDEDRQGKSLVGEAGELLIKIIQAINLTPESVYVCSLVKCRPKDRNPEPDEIAACFPLLKKQLEIIAPKFICAFGALTAQTLLNRNDTISILRGQFYDLNGIQVIPTFDPASLLVDQSKKRDVWDDMKVLMKDFNRNTVETQSRAPLKA